PGSGHSIQPLPERDVRRMRHGARRFRRRLATIPGRRQAPFRQGTVDLRDTVRHSLRHGGEWVEIRHQRPRSTRTEFVILWDVSGSMREHEGKFFALVHALCSVSRRARVFAFSTRVEEITPEVRRSGYRRACGFVGRRVDRADGGTRIGRSLVEFSERYGATLNARTTIFVLSDGWDLGEAEIVAKELGRLSRRVHRIVWVTPYTRRPGFEPRVGALRAGLAEIDVLLGPEDFEARWPLRPFLA
ncbi:MAG: VWA domain-containing protein, partial [Thermoplasmata archaeon]